jgi:amino acid transporter
VAAGVLVSTFGNLNGGMLVTARLVLALARDGTLPRSLRAINRHATPGNAIIVDCAVSVLLLAATDFAALVANGVVVTWAFLALIGASLPILRRTRPNERRPYRVWGYPWIPTFFVAGTAVVLAVQLVSDPFHSAVSLAALLAGLPLYAVSRVLHARSGPGSGAKTAGAPK